MVVIRGVTGGTNMPGARSTRGTSGGFRVGGETREWHEGEAFVFDDTIEHEAWNDSDHLRAVLIFDVWNPWLTLAERDLIRGLFASGSAVLGAVGEEEFRP